MTENVEEEPGGGPAKGLESSVLGMISWWLKKNSRAEVVVLIIRHYRPEVVFLANQMLAEACQLEKQTLHKNSQLRSAGEANAIDLLNNMGLLDDEKRAPRYLIPSDELGSILVSEMKSL